MARLSVAYAGGFASVIKFWVYLDSEADCDTCFWNGYRYGGWAIIYILASTVAAPPHILALLSINHILPVGSPRTSVPLAVYSLFGVTYVLYVCVRLLKHQRDAFKRQVYLDKAQKQANRLHQTEQRQFQLELEAEKDKADLAVHEARENAHNALLKTMSHDFKGTVLNLGSHLAAVQEPSTSRESHVPALGAELTHITYSIMAIKYRVSIYNPGASRLSVMQNAVVSELKPLLANLAVLFPEVEFEVLDVEARIVPCLLHLALYQLFRNARVHGGGGCTCVTTIDHNQVVILIRNLPGSKHKELVEAGRHAMELALSGAVGTISSSGLGLQDVSQICNSCNFDFSIQWREKDVLAHVKLPFVPKVPDSPSQHQELDLRVCVVDDQYGARMLSTKLIQLVLPDYDAPPKLRLRNAVWEDEFVKVAGATYDEIQECIQWVHQATSPSQTIVFLDRMLEYPGCVLDGVNLISDFNDAGALVVMRSGNDSDEDRALYKENGAFGSVPKVLHTTCEANTLIQHFLAQLQQQEMQKATEAGAAAHQAELERTNGAQAEIETEHKAQLQAKEEESVKKEQEHKGADRVNADKAGPSNLNDEMQSPLALPPEFEVEIMRAS